MSYENPFPEIQIASKSEAEQLVRDEPNKWSVISISSVDNARFKREGKIYPLEAAVLKKAKNLCCVHFDDITREEKDYVICSPDHITQILKFAWSVRGQPLLVHCYAGIRRSAAMMFLILLDNIQSVSEFPIEDALGMVLHARPICYPNKHIMHLGIQMLANKDYRKEVGWMRELYNCQDFKRIYG